MAMALGIVQSLSLLGTLLSAGPRLSSPQLYGADDLVKASRKEGALAQLSHIPMHSQTGPARTVGLWGPQRQREPQKVSQSCRLPAAQRRLGRVTE